ncbi:hypothetical protein ACFLSF_03640 [Candidatus Bipolaricaulota bacterium]
MKRALVLSLICVVGLAFAGFAQTLTGSWDTEVCLDPQTDSFAGAIDLTSTLSVTYAIGDWAFTSVTELTGAGWSDQDFSVTGLFGLITVSSALGFNPLAEMADMFDGWVTTLGLNMAGVSFSATFNLNGGNPFTSTPYDRIDGTLLTLTGTAGIGSAVEGTVTVWLGGTDNPDCDFDFYGVEIGLSFLFCDCAPIDMTIAFDCDGFDYVSFEATEIAVPNVPWLTFDALLVFELQTKTITLSPVFDFGVFVCIDLYIYADSTEEAVAPYDAFEFLYGFAVEGIGISCEIGGVSFSALSNWHDYGAGYEGYRPGALAYMPYEIWEVYSIDVGADACCGGVFEFGLDVFFNDSILATDALFDVDSISANMTVNVTTQFAFTMGIDMDVVDGLTDWCVGFEVTW